MMECIYLWRSSFVLAATITLQSGVDLRQTSHHHEHTSIDLPEDVAARFKGYGWNTSHIADVNDLTPSKSSNHFNAKHAIPTFITLDSHLGYGAPHNRY